MPVTRIGMRRSGILPQPVAARGIGAGFVTVRRVARPFVCIGQTHTRTVVVVISRKGDNQHSQERNRP